MLYRSRPCLAGHAKATEELQSWEKMLDLVQKDGLASPPKVVFVAAGSLGNFRLAQDAKAARSDARVKSVLLCVLSLEADEGVIKDVKRAGGAIVFPLAPLLSEAGFRRAIAISKMRILYSACEKAGCDAVFCSLAASDAMVRNGREIEAFAVSIGMGRDRFSRCQEVLARLSGEGVK